MYNRHIRHLVTELGNRLSDKEFLKKIGLSRRSMQQLFDNRRRDGFPSLINIRPTFCTRMRISLCPQLLMRRLRSIS